MIVADHLQHQSKKRLPSLRILSSKRNRKSKQSILLLKAARKTSNNVKHSLPSF